MSAALRPLRSNYSRDESIHEKWVHFVQQHRAKWNPTKTSVLCSVHFDASDFEHRIDINLGEGSEFKAKRLLKKEAVLSKDCVKQQERAPSLRERRQVSIYM